MSMNSRYRERKYNTSDNDRLLRALSQPVQAWDKKWTPHSNSKTLQTYKWVKSERTIEYEQDEESEEEPEPMETEPSLETAPVETTTDIHIAETNEGTEQTTTTTTATTTTTVNDTVTATATGVEISTMPNSSQSEQTIPGGPSTLLTNKALTTVQQDMEEDNRRSETPKLDDISDEEVTTVLEEEDGADASKHPALAPHAQAHLSDDDESMTDSTAVTPQTEGNTPMPQLEGGDEDMEQTNALNAHPLSQEILTGVPHDMASLNNDSPSVQTPEDVVSHHD
ncbi:hypothetical protein INT47_002772 [Mucor saturninus]|uniref:Uncharacterized protein n=1 Tax=Mucor saturninus TaxID=64648 RepID=A0A8H7QZS9_9FUNG|nr:hypothetical protein INT47_002772 [Mucor saturninus]